MPDVIAINTVKNGGVTVSIGVLGVMNNHELSPKINQNEFAKNSGILETRLDDVRYYSGDSSS